MCFCGGGDGVFINSNDSNSGDNAALFEYVLVWSELAYPLLSHDPVCMVIVLDLRNLAKWGDICV